MSIDLDKIKMQKTLKQLLEFSVINIDKPSGPTSFSVADKVRKKLQSLGVRKTSHFGTLDPKVTGVLPIALNRACRLTGYFMKKDKTYVGIMRLHESLVQKKIENEMQKFLGKISQKPPVRSRVKRVEREREIKRFIFLEKDHNDVLFLVEVEAGTYIRKLIDDLGKNIGGAHMLELRRSQAGIFEEKSSITLYQLDEALESLKQGDEQPLKNLLIPGEIVTQIYPASEIKKEYLPLLLKGSPVLKHFLKSTPIGEKNASIVVVCEGQFVEMAKVVQEREVYATPEFVLN